MNLYCIRDLKREIERRRFELENLRLASTAPTAPKLDGLPHAKPMTSRPELFAQKIIDAESELAALDDEFGRLSTELAFEIVRRVPKPNQQRVLIERYVNCLPFAGICAGMNYSDGSIYRLHRHGKIAFERLDRE